VTYFDSCFARVAGRAERLEVRQVEAKLGMRPHRLDVIDLKPTDSAALNAAPAVTPLRLQA
jgi:hypothetical protein